MRGTPEEIGPDGGGGGDAPAPDPGDRPVALVTGATDGLGREVALRLASGGVGPEIEGRGAGGTPASDSGAPGAAGPPGARVIVHGRDPDRGREVVRTIEDAGGSAELRLADFASLDEVRALAEGVRADHDRLHVLVNNAGIYKTPRGRAESEDGVELRFQVNYLAHFLLTLRLLPLLERAADEGGPARIVNVASGAQDAIDFDDVLLERGFSESRAYGQSKLAQILFTISLAERLEGSGIRVNALHPATFMDTTMVRDAGVRPRSTVDEGARGVLRLIREEVGTGGFFDGTRPARAHSQAYDAEARRRLWKLSEDLAGVE